VVKPSVAVSTVPANKIQLEAAKIIIAKVTLSIKLLDENIYLLLLGNDFSFGLDECLCGI
jgi:hypothetical protein